MFYTYLYSNNTHSFQYKTQVKVAAKHAKSKTETILYHY